MLSLFSQVVGCPVKQQSVERLSPLAFVYDCDTKRHWLFETSPDLDVSPHSQIGH